MRTMYTLFHGIKEENKYIIFCFSLFILFYHFQFPSPIIIPQNLKELYLEIFVPLKKFNFKIKMNYLTHILTYIRAHAHIRIHIYTHLILWTYYCSICSICINRCQLIEQLIKDRSRSILKNVNQYKHTRQCLLIFKLPRAVLIL